MFILYLVTLVRGDPVQRAGSLRAEVEELQVPWLQLEVLHFSVVTSNNLAYDC